MSLYLCMKNVSGHYTIMFLKKILLVRNLFAIFCKGAFFIIDTSINFSLFDYFSKRKSLLVVCKQCVATEMVTTRPFPLRKIT